MKTYGPEGWDEQQATLPTHGYAFHQCSPVTSAVAVVPGWHLEVAGGPGSSSSPTQLPKCRLSSQPHHPRKRRRIGAATPSSHQPIRHLDRGGNTSLSHKNLMCMRRFTVASPPCRMQEYSCLRWFTVAFFPRPHPVSPSGLGWGRHHLPSACEVALHAVVHGGITFLSRVLGSLGTLGHAGSWWRASQIPTRLLGPCGVLFA